SRHNLCNRSEVSVGSAKSGMGTASVDRRSFFNSSRVGVVPKSSIKSGKLRSRGSGRGGGEAGAYSGEVKGESLRASITSRVGGRTGGSGNEVSAGAETSGRTDIRAC